MWDDAHAKRQLHAYSQTRTSFAQEVNDVIPKQSTILELGCGEGNDSTYFADQGHIVTATDFSERVVSSNSQNLTRSGLQFQVLDISKPFEYPGSSFDVIYARLSLHYFTNDDTQKIFNEIARVLVSGGYVCFMCKSVDDALYGQGLQIEADMFELNGHVRHFFNEDYVRQLLVDNGFKIDLLEKGREKLYERESAFIKVIAQKK